MPSGSRLVASSARVGHPCSSASANFAHAPMTCSQLSSSTSRLRRSIASTSVSVTGRPGSWRTPSTLATVTATRPCSPSGARSANHTPSLPPSASPAATCRPSRVLPAPPVPVSVTSRDPLTSARTAASSASRPMKLDTCAGRLFCNSAPGPMARMPLAPSTEQRTHHTSAADSSQVPQRRRSARHWTRLSELISRPVPGR